MARPRHRSQYIRTDNILITTLFQSAWRRQLRFDGNRGGGMSHAIRTTTRTIWGGVQIIQAAYHLGRFDERDF
jgi:hypothetical protein